MIGLPDLWYRQAVIYAVDVESFHDSDGDGVGDFRGLTQRLEHIASLGATCLWLLPFHPTPNRDDGYDVADYYGVDPRLGTLGDFVDFLHAARDRGLRVLIDLVVNHTSSEHPWFVDACRSRDARYHDFYVWSYEKPERMDEGAVFPGVQDRTWTYVKSVRAWYFHRFYEHQPDLDTHNPAVREEIRKVMGFWAELGVSGFRVDAAPFVIEAHGGAAHRAAEEPALFLERMREFLTWRRGDAVLLGEANVALDELGAYVGEGDRLNLLFAFYLNQHLFLAMARGEAEPVRRAWAALPAFPRTATWAHFLRNHDELDLGRLSDEERAEVFAAMGPDPSMQLYGRGIRRRLPPMLGGDRRRLELAHALLLSLPGTPVLRYGDEIGMGDDLSLPERTAVRTPMQWADAPNAGFSTAPADRLVHPVVSEGPFGYPRVNVAAQQRDPTSLLAWVRNAVRARRECVEIGWGEGVLVEVDDPAVLAHACTWEGGVTLAVHNLSDRAVEARLVPPVPDRDWTLILSDDPGAGVRADPSTVLLAPYGYRWFRCGGVRPPPAAG